MTKGRKPGMVRLYNQEPDLPENDAYVMIDKALAEVYPKECWTGYFQFKDVIPLGNGNSPIPD